ncbi:molybdopterin cofactor-binding domain-containing protein [Tropicimonas sp. S265A]|uniref:xanthine dehydrogenase family protein molybdopterin-binding subunit n=1 Tax=Tropicimonas sp. S265A TaxID=3415134 RepID=UPI003C7A0796
MLHYLEHALAAPKPSRRSFLKLSAGALGGLLLGAKLPNTAMAQNGDDGLIQPFVHITPDNRIIVLSKHLDKGQGAATGLATLVAEELDADPAQVAVEFAPSNPQVYANLAFGIQGTGGSTAMSNSWSQYREAGAAARAMLVSAAADAWGVAPDAITVAAGRLTSGENSASFGEMAGPAASQAVPEAVTLKAPEDWVLIGKTMNRVELPAKTKGSVGMFGVDVQPDDVLIAVTARPPRFGGTVVSVDAAEALAMPGVQQVLTIPQGVVVVADNTWRAMQARDALNIEWDFSNAENRGTDALQAEYRALLDQTGLPAGTRGTGAAKLADAAELVELDFSFPFLAHAQLEPLNVTIEFDGSRARLWSGFQMQTVDHSVASAVLGIPMDAVEIHTTWAGGSFGRRAIADGHYAAEAAMIGKAWLEATGAPQPIKMIYSREDDIKGGYYRPMHMHRVRAGVDGDGNLSGWDHRIVGQGIFFGTAFEEYLVKDGVDHSSVEGVVDTPYAIPDMSTEVHHTEVGVPILWWRSVGHTHTAYVMEVMMDRLARAAGRDPVEFRLAHLEGEPRLAAALRRAVSAAGDLPEGLHRGVAVHKSFNSYVGEVADIRMREDGTVKVEKVTCAIDCGVAINPDNVVAQVEGAMAYGLSGVLREEITMTDGEVDQFNYPDYTPLRMTDMPEVVVEIIESTEDPTGVGEPGTPPIGPAVANAVAAATGQVVTDLPFSKHGLA